MENKYNNLEVCASRYLKCVFLMQEWEKAQKPEDKDLIMGGILGALKLTPDEMEVITDIVNENSVSPEPDEDE